LSAHTHSSPAHKGPFSAHKTSSPAHKLPFPAHNQMFIGCFLKFLVVVGIRPVQALRPQCFSEQQVEDKAENRQKEKNEDPRPCRSGRFRSKNNTSITSTTLMRTKILLTVLHHSNGIVIPPCFPASVYWFDQNPFSNPLPSLHLI
ncbi:hypothetical protein, partial [Planococcus sp. CAU13]|uniref:hypothetical protein n=1 Tax=Planococcus sp. CAU13 TaxID=1541197 RepID=UPI003FA685E2